MYIALQSAVYMRTLFSYDPSLDEHHPCLEAGLKFDPGAVLQIVDQEDPKWWQAVKDGDKRARAGIIPSKSYTERLALLKCMSLELLSLLLICSAAHPKKHVAFCLLLHVVNVYFVIIIRREMYGNIRQEPTRKRSKVKATQYSMSMIGKFFNVISRL